MTATAPVSSGDGLTTTASSSKSLALPAAGVFYGIREAKEDWTTLAAKLKTSADIATWLKAQKTDVDNWSARSRERADMVGGWVQNYLDPKTGALVTWTPDSPEPTKIAGTGEQKFYEAWVAYVRGYNIARTQMAARIYRLTGETKYGEWAAKQLDFYAKNYKTWPVRTFNGRGQMYRHGLDEAYDSFTLVDAARLLEGYGGTARNAAWRDGLFLPMAENLKTVTSPMTNISLWHYAAMAGIGVRYKNSSLLDYAQNSSQGMLAVLKNGVTADNLWIEGTFAYNDYVVDALSKLLVGASLEGQSSRFSAERDYTLRLLLAAFDYRFADNMLPNPSDSAARLPVATPAVHWKLFRVLPTYYGVDLASRWRTWESLLDPPASSSLTAPQLPAVYTRNFPAIRMAVLKSGTWQAFVHYGQAAANHAQEEALTYELYEGNTQISTDSGTVSYTSPFHTDYFSRGPANNVVLIDGLGQVSWNKGEVSSFSATENRLVAKQANYRPGASVSRGYRVTSSGFAEQTSIALSSLQAGLLPSAKRLGLAFHSACQIAPLSGLNPSATTPLPSAIGLSYWTDLAMWTAGGSWQAQLTCGSKTYTLSVSGPGSQRVYIGKAPTTPLPTKRNVLYFETVGTSANFSSEIRPSN
ncbi:heparinase II/III family protein [Paucibacter sediminis]|uniref:Heparinase II/III family protein n=1 Tax=Paucibacter sediminis TaxID=3019553 RepID=A0AA95SJJ7_9BURK|nr:heparinase II/III family protein [Paucibacter sp. S2-9]WIT10058.1 heparinase II/III family protein [Paucibacter sp. S2-9]